MTALVSTVTGPGMPTHHPFYRDQHLRWLVGCGSVGIAPIIGLINLGRPSLWFDEAFSVDLAQMPSNVFWHTIVNKEANQSAYFVLLRYWPGLGHGDFGNRSLSVVFTLLASIFLFGLTKQLFDFKTACISVAVFGLMPFSVQATQEARGYSLLMLAATASTFALLRSLDSSPWWPLYGLSIAILPYVHFYGLFVIIAHVIWMLAHENRAALRRYTYTTLLGLLCAAPMFLFFVEHRTVGQLKFLHRPTWHQASLDVAAFGGNLNYGLLLLLLAFFGALVGFRQKSSLHLRLIIAWALVAPVLSVCYSLADKPIYQLRYLAGETPAIAILIALACRAAINRMLSVVVPLVVVITIASALPGHMGPLIHEDWRGADALLAQNLNGETRFLQRLGI